MIKEILKMAMKNGYKALMCKGKEGYGFLITPNGNVMMINEEYFSGYNISLKYVPSAKSGTGCAAYDEYNAPTEYTMELIEEKEQELLKWARRMKVEFYASPEAFIEWYEGFYNTKLEEVA